MMNDTLVRPSRIAAQSEARPPVVVVGLPRSGSSFLSHLLSQIEGYYVFDDLYLLEKADDLGIRGRMTSEQLQQLLYWLGWQIRARKRWGTYAVPDVEEAEIDRLNAALTQAFTDHAPTVLDLQEEWLLRLAHRSGAAGWGFKMPKAFQRLADLRERHPDLKVIFLMRQPHDVLASYKHMPQGDGDGDPRRYHPLAYAFYWKRAAQALQQELQAHPGETVFLNFADLTGSPLETARQLALFLDADPPAEISVPPKPNTSHRSERPRSKITGMESWMVNTICRKEMAGLGFEMRKAGIRPRDFWEITQLTGRFLWFRYVTEPLEKRRQRERIARHA